MALALPDNETWTARCATDGEFLLAARHWHGGLVLKIGDTTLSLSVTDDGISAKPPRGERVLTFSGDIPVWEKLLAPVPPRFYTDTLATLSAGEGLSREGDSVVHAQYYGAAMRAIELLRPEAEFATKLIPSSGNQFDSPIGRYIHLDIAGDDHRIYFEEAGEGIPLLLQHTAGCHGSQWRHLLECRQIREHFRLIAYDLPYHGKSLPPTSKVWWQEKYDLTGDFLRAIPLSLANALKLERPVFMGCSVGGLLALDLAWRHSDLFRAVISVEGALHIPGSVNRLSELWHPQVSNEYKARAMEGLMSPTSPRPYVKETSFVYAAGWPQAFLGDLYYYLEDFDLRNVAAEINTAQVGVHILSGEYDHSGRSELGREAHETIKGSTWAEMKGVGHFPMSENPVVFIEHLIPILDAIRNQN